MSATACSRCGAKLLEQSASTLCEKCHGAWLDERQQLSRFYDVPIKMIEGIRMVLDGLQEAYPAFKPQANHMDQTPARVGRMFLEICWGLGVDPAKHLGTTFEETQYGGIVLVSGIQFTSLCMHHFAIFRGIAHVGYIPNRRIVGLSKINRVVEILAARPQVQEQLTFQIADLLHSTLKPKGTMVVLEGSHDCIEVRGVRSKGSITKTSEVRGIFHDNKFNCKDEFMALIETKKG